MKNSYIWKNKKEPKKMEENWNMHGDITNMLIIVMENNIMQCFSLALKTSFCEK